MSRYFLPKEFIFNQDTPASVWTIKHACGFPSIDIYITENGKVERIIPFEIKFISESVSEVHFTRPFAGFAKIVG